MRRVSGEGSNLMDWKHSTPEEIFEDILRAISQDTGLPVEALKSGRTELTIEELRAWQIAHGFVGPEGK
jgi:hypothetical protein